MRERPDYVKHPVRRKTDTKWSSHKKNIAMWLLGVLTALGGAGIETYYRAQQIPQINDTLQEIQKDISDIKGRVSAIEQHTADLQGDTDQIRADVRNIQATQRANLGTLPPMQARQPVATTVETTKRFPGVPSHRPPLRELSE